MLMYVKIRKSMYELKQKVSTIKTFEQIVYIWFHIIVGNMIMTEMEIEIDRLLCR
jgi:hypothetical protein